MDDVAKAKRSQGDMRVHANTLASLFALGGSLIIVTAAPHQPERADTIGLLGVAVAAYAVAGVVRFGRRWLPDWAYPAFVFVGTVFITFAINFSGEGSSAYAFFYLWVCIYSFYFFSRTLAAVELAVVGIAYALVLAFGPDSSAPVARWVLTLGTMSVSGALIARLVDQVRERAAEAAARAEHLREAEERTRAILETASDGFVAAGADLRITTFNAQAEEMSGYSRDEVMGKRLTEILVPERFAKPFEDEFARFVQTGHSDLVNRPIEFVGKHRDGHEFPIELTISPLREGGVWTFNAFVRNIAERKRNEQQIRDHTEDLTRVAQVSRDLAGVTDAHAARPAICKAAAELAGAKVAILYEPDPKGQELVSTAVIGAQVDQIHLPFAGRPSGAATAFSSGQPLFLADLPDNPAVAQTVRKDLGVNSGLWQPVVHNDVPIGVLTVAWEERIEAPSERVLSLMSLLAAEAAVAIERADLLARLEAVARTDDLTGLANRRAWDEHLPRELARAGREKRPLCVAMLDLDHFKEYNDERGHQAGDRLLKQVSAAWREMLRPSDLLARYGGEEFGLVLPNCPLPKGLDVVERLREYTVAGQTCSAGIAVWDGEETSESLVRRADSALYEAKNAGRDQSVTAS